MGQRWRKKFYDYRETDRKIKNAAPDILNSKNFRDTKMHIQHGDVTVHNHCLNVARYSVNFNKKMRIGCKETELIRGALLHDYFLYDWHDKEHIQLHNLHGFYHPSIALNNASKEYDLTPREMDIIKKHMWPLTFIPPMCREAWVVTAMDKWCSILETFHILKGHGKKRI